MTDRLICSNCGAPMTRQGNEPRGTCSHCQHVTEFAPLPVQGRDAPHQDLGAGRSGPDHVPQIVIIQGGPQVVRQPTPVIVNTVSSSFSLVSWLVYIAVFVGLSGGVGGWVHHKHAQAAAANPSANALNAATNAAEKAQKEAAEATEKAEKASAAAAAEHHEAVEKRVERVPTHVGEHVVEHHPAH